MRTIEHTPGPWQMEEHPNMGFGFDITAPHAGCRCDPHVCQLHPRQNTCSLRRIDVVCQSARERDARLIAAAPKLLEVLREIVEYAQDGWDTAENLGNLIQRARVVVRSAAAVIPQEERGR